jgi:hypothetical protein
VSTGRADPERGAEQRFARRRAEGDQDCWPQQPHFGLPPGPTCPDVASIRALVDATLSTARVGAPAEMLDRVGHVRVAFVDTGLAQGTTQQTAGRSDERFAALVLHVAGLFAQQHEPNVFRVARPAAEDRLSGAAI